MRNPFLHNTAVGIHISDSFVEVMQMDENRDVLMYAKKILPTGTVQDGIIRNKLALQAKLKEIVQSINGPYTACCSLPDSKTYTHFFTLPADVSGPALREAVHKQAFALIPLEPSMVYGDMQVIRAAFEHDQRVLFVAVEKKIADDYYDVLHNAGFQALIFESKALALTRAICTKNPREKDVPKLPLGSILTIDIDQNETSINISTPHCALVSSTSLPMGEKSLAAVIATKLNITQKDAEMQQRNFGLDYKNPGNKIFLVLQAGYQRIVSEVKNAITFYEANTGEQIKEIFLTGVGVRTPKALEYISANLNRTITIGNPSIDKKNTAFMQGNPSALFAPVIGLAMRALNHDTNLINLIPRISPRTQESKNYFPSFPILPRTILLWFLAAIIAVAFGFFFWNLLGLFNNRLLPGKFRLVPPPSSQILLTPTPTTPSPTLSHLALPLASSSPTAMMPQTIIIAATPTGWLNVRQGPGQEFLSFKKVFPGEQYPLLKTSGDWYNIQLPDSANGWITSAYTKIQEKK